MSFSFQYPTVTFVSPFLCLTLQLQVVSPNVYWYFLVVSPAGCPFLFLIQQSCCPGACFSIFYQTVTVVSHWYLLYFLRGCYNRNRPDDFSISYPIVTVVYARMPVLFLIQQLQSYTPRMPFSFSFLAVTVVSPEYLFLFFYPTLKVVSPCCLFPFLTWQLQSYPPGWVFLFLTR